MCIFKANAVFLDLLLIKESWKYVLWFPQKNKHLQVSTFILKYIKILIICSNTS